MTEIAKLYSIKRVFEIKERYVMIMKKKGLGFYGIVLACTYVYLTLPMVIFLLGWCRWYIGIPASLVVIYGVLRCMKEHGRRRSIFKSNDMIKIIVIVGIVLLWVCLSGIGGYAWQNTDHQTRNTLFELLVQEKWPVVREVEQNGYIQSKGLVYYIGFWLPATIIGKIFGVEAGYAAQYVWAVFGILLFYAMICIWRKKVSVWPLILIILFSGLDIVGILITQPMLPEAFGVEHMEAWSVYYQYSSMTTQLFWVFNQAIPIWLAAGLIFLCEKPKNMIFVWALMLLTSSLPSVGLIPYVIYFMIRCCDWKEEYRTPGELAASCWKNWASFQNIAAGGVAGIISGLYVLGNNALIQTFDFSTGTVPEVGWALTIFVVILLVLLFVLGFCGIFYLIKKGWGKRIKQVLFVLGTIIFVFMVVRSYYAEWQSPLFLWVNLTVFFFLEAGVFLICVYPMIEEKGLFWLNTIWLYVIPLIVIGKSCDFCMRASIPGLLLIIMWCIQMLDGYGKSWKTYLLIGLLAVGALTPIHEIKRTYVCTQAYYENINIEEIGVFWANNFSGSTDGFFWKNIAKPQED